MVGVKGSEQEYGAGFAWKKESSGFGFISSLTFLLYLISNYVLYGSSIQRLQQGEGTAAQMLRRGGGKAGEGVIGAE